MVLKPRKSFLSYFILLFSFLFLSCSYLKRWNVEGVKPNVPVYQVHFNKNLDPVYDTGNLPISILTPLDYEGILYAADARGIIQAISLGDGRTQWSHNEDVALGPKPVLYKDQVIYGSISGRIFSRHYLTGELKYALDLGSSVAAPPCIYQGRAFFHLRDHRIINIDAETGKILWSYKRSVPYSTTIHRASTPVVYQNHLYVGLADGYLASLSIDDGVLAWERQLSSGTKFIDVDSTPVFAFGYLWVGPFSGSFSVLDPKSGETVRSYEFTAGRTPFALHDQVYVGTINGELIRIEKDLNVSLKKKISDKGITNIALWKNKLVVSTTGRKLYFLDPLSFDVVSTLTLGGSHSAIYGDLEVTPEYLSFITARNRLMVLK